MGGGSGPHRRAPRATAGIALCGPNCLGIVNYVDGVPLTFSLQQVPVQRPGPAIAVVAQSGGLATILRNALQARELPIAYTVSTGNEAVLGLEDYIEYRARAMRAPRVVTAFAEQIRQPAALSRHRRPARARRGKAIVLLHPGRSAAARASAQSHTGALAGDHAVMTHARRASRRRHGRGHGRAHRRRRSC